MGALALLSTLSYADVCEDVPGATVTLDKGEINCETIKGDDCYDNIKFEGDQRRDEKLRNIITKCRKSCAGTQYEVLPNRDGNLDEAVFLDLVAKGFLKVVKDNGENGKIGELGCFSSESGSGSGAKVCEDVPGATVTLDKGEINCETIKGDDCYDNIKFEGDQRR